jgi:hypothetical protein
MPLSPLYAYIFHNPSGYTCTINPSGYNNVVNGSTYTFTVSCSSGGNNPPPGGSGNNYYVYVTVTNDTLGAGWQISSSVKSISGSGNVNNEQLPIGGQTDTVYASITSNPSGYTCTINPSSEQVSSGNSYTFTVSCVQSSQSQPPPTTYGCFLTVYGQSNPQGAANVNVNPSNEVFVPSGQSETITATAPLQVGGNPWYEFDSWSGSVTSGPGSLSGPSTSTNGNAQSTWQYACPSGLTSNESATVTITANYVYDYIDLVGPLVVSSSPVKYTLEWDVAPGSAYQVSWSVTHGSTAFTVSAKLYYTEYGKSLSGGSSLQATVYCSVGQPLISNAYVVGPTTYSVSGSSSSTSVKVEVTWDCLVNRGQ